jgi:hypothetical protein
MNDKGIILPTASLYGNVGLGPVPRQVKTLNIIPPGLLDKWNHDRWRNISIYKLMLCTASENLHWEQRNFPDLFDIS